MDYEQNAICFEKLENVTILMEKRSEGLRWQDAECIV
jgi:hypothetical protein